MVGMLVLGSGFELGAQEELTQEELLFMEIPIVVSAAKMQQPITAANLAITLAQAGGKILLLDTDLRKPRIHQIFSVDNTAGLSNIVATGQDPWSLIKKTDIPNQ